MISIGVNTKLVGLLGYPLKQSFSPAMQNGAFAELGLDYAYFPIEVGPEGLSDVVKGIRQMNFAGFNVTKPNKIAIMQHLDEIDISAKSIGAVNTVKVTDGRLKGYNTDGAGFATFLTADMGIVLENSTLFMLGCGGAGRAIATILAKRGVRQLFVTDLVEASAQSLEQDVNRQMGGKVKYVAFGTEAMRRALEQAEVVVNATAVGMYPEENLVPLPIELLDKRMVVCDIIYNPPQTKLLREASRLGCRTSNGIGMVVYQGAEAFRIWTGVDAPISQMTKIVKSLAGVDPHR